MKIDLTGIEKNYLSKYSDIKAEVARSDGKGVGYQFADGTFLSFDPSGNLNAAVTPTGHATSLGGWETFFRQGFIAIHNISGAAIPIYPFDIPTV